MAVCKPGGENPHRNWVCGHRDRGPWPRANRACLLPEPPPPAPEWHPVWQLLRLTFSCTSPAGAGCWRLRAFAASLGENQDLRSLDSECKCQGPSWESSGPEQLRSLGRGRGPGCWSRASSGSPLTVGGGAENLRTFPPHCCLGPLLRQGQLTVETQNTSVPLPG